MILNRDESRSREPVKGVFFHLVGDDGIIQRQGMVETMRADGDWTVHYFDWILGDMNGPHDMKPLEWSEIRFYPTDVDMREAGFAALEGAG